MKNLNRAFLILLSTTLLGSLNVHAEPLADIFTRLPLSVEESVVQNECGAIEAANAKDVCIKELKEQNVEVQQLSKEEAAAEQLDADKSAAIISESNTPDGRDDGNAFHKKEKISVKSQLAILMGLGLLDYGIVGVEYNGVDQHGNLLFWAGADLSIVRQGTRFLKNEENISIGGYTSSAKKTWARGFGFGAFVTFPAYNGYKIGGGPEVRYDYNHKKIGFSFFVRSLFIPGKKEWDQHAVIIMPNFGIKLRFNCLKTK